MKPVKSLISRKVRCSQTSIYNTVYYPVLRHTSCELWFYTNTEIHGEVYFSFIDILIPVKKKANEEITKNLGLKPPRSRGI